MFKLFFPGGKPLARNFQLPGRSPVIAENGLVATSHPLASVSALEVLKAGGNAADAAVAAAATLAVVEPQMTGIGGDCFAIVCTPDGTVTGIDGAGRAAAGAHAEWYAENGFTEIPEHSAHAVTVPGAVRGWETLLAVHGTLGFDRLLRDAIRYAEEGYAVAPRVAFDWAKHVETLAKDEGARHHLLIDGKAPRIGQRHRQPALADTLRMIAKNGADAFYTGAIAAEIAATLQAKGGFLTEEDIAACKTSLVNPLEITYQNHELRELPPSGQGMVAMIMLNLLDLMEARRHPDLSAERYHCEIEAARLAYSVRDAWLSDPDVMPVAAEKLISRDFAETLAVQFDPAKRNQLLTLPGLPNSDTVYLSIVDRDRMAVSFINSLYGDFGAQIVTPESGITLQNRGNCFSADPNHPNAIGPRKRPLHTIIPAMVTKDGLPAISFGVMGGSYQPMGHAHVLGNMLDYGMDPQAAIDHPRVFWDDEGVIRAEDGLPGDVAEKLRAMGHPVAPATGPRGGGQAVVIDRETGFLIGGSDPRKDGCALGW
ncbi:gamma-glutamyltransferase [Oricola nitratireducens]|uniref:gamma-glutamyltransferase n=1 Tax=Oricola nitratireducens TaxID=2775868 RepID=UPI001868249D|nr:gamma-glutamyltransferase [Oricola nitratireducens]